MIEEKFINLYLSGKYIEAEEYICPEVALFLKEGKLDEISFLLRILKSAYFLKEDPMNDVLLYEIVRVLLSNDLEAEVSKSERYQDIIISAIELLFMSYDYKNAENIFLKYGNHLSLFKQTSVVKIVCRTDYGFFPYDIWFEGWKKNIDKHVSDPTFIGNEGFIGDLKFIKKGCIDEKYYDQVIIKTKISKSEKNDSNREADRYMDARNRILSIKDTEEKVRQLELLLSDMQKDIGSLKDCTNIELIFGLKLIILRWMKYSKINKVVNKDPNPQQYDECWILWNPLEIYSLTFLTPFSFYAHKNNIRTIVPFQGPFYNESSALPEFDGVFTSWERNSWEYKGRREIKEKWIIDLENKKIECRGINFYHGIYEYVVRQQYGYFLDHNDYYTIRKINDLVSRVDGVIRYLLEVKESFKDKRVKIFGLNTHYPLASILRDFCDSTLNTYGIEYFSITPGYENYFNQSTRACKSISVLNCTKNYHLRFPFLGNEKQFHKYISHHMESIDQIKVKVDAIVKQERREFSLVDSNNVVGRLKEFKKDKKVFLALGRVPFDIAYRREEEGIFHQNISEWITDLVHRFKNTDNVLILRPHPHEDNFGVTVSKFKRVSFIDLIKCELPNNVIIADPKEVTMDELTEHVDGVFMWGGTSAMEFTIKKIPIYCFDNTAFYNYPIDLYKVKTIDEFDRIIRGEVTHKPTKRQIMLAYMFISYMASDYVMNKVGFIKYFNSNLKQLERCDVDFQNVYLDEKKFLAMINNA